MIYDIGLDISTSVIGISLISSDKEELKKEKLNFDSIVFDKKDNFWDKTKKAQVSLQKISEKYDVDRIFIEQDFQKFRPGFSSAKTINILSKMNGIVSYIAMSIFESEPISINVNSARKVLGIKVNRKLKLSTKVQVFEEVKNRLKIDWPQRKLKSGHNKGKLVYDKCAYDMVDAWVICKAGQLLNM